MNTRLEQLFEKYNILPKDRHEINQIFGLLPTSKQINLLNNFERLAIKLEQINMEINLERRILIGDLFRDIDNFYEKYKNKIGTL